MVICKKVYIRDGRAPIPKKEVTSRIMSSIKAKNTKPELQLRRAIWKQGVRGYRLFWDRIPGKPDITFPKRKIAIFVNGCYWHRCPLCNPPMPKSNVSFWQAKFLNNQARDSKNRKTLEDRGWCVIIVWECQIKKELSECVERIIGILKKH